MLGRRGLLEAGGSPHGDRLQPSCTGTPGQRREEWWGVVRLLPHQQACRSGPSALVTFLEAPPGARGSKVKHEGDSRSSCVRLFTV